ncbi:hypothetical protein LT85_1481 [Collimonas arenae]|uniref:Uncharacterized protein n=1 Tax=Collimonas arenae TaxID=279058 RepID=A0A0A1FAD7_9BURK|nr:hypothetical protein LT85_1481 [Collimonas arenae]
MYLVPLLLFAGKSTSTNPGVVMNGFTLFCQHRLSRSK